MPFSAQAVGGMFGCYFRSLAPESFAQVMQSDGEAFNRFFHQMLDRGVYFAPSAFEAGFVSTAHTDASIEASGVCRRGCVQRTGATSRCKPWMNSDTAWISRSDSLAAIMRIILLGSFARSSDRNALSWADVYSACWPASRGYCLGMPAPSGK